MITDNNRKATMIAYYFSKFDKRAMKALGYASLSSAFSDLSSKIGKDNNYIKLRRDEFDPLTKSHRQGFKNRKPAKIVELYHHDCANFSFEEFTSIIKLIINDETCSEPLILSKNDIKNLSCYEEMELEQIMNFEDSESCVYKSICKINRKILDRSINDKLKSLYHHKCQICGQSTFNDHGVDISEAHHIDYFSVSFNNNASNIIVLCPNHHRLIHKTKAKYNCKLKQFLYPNKTVDALKFNLHL